MRFLYTARESYYKHSSCDAWEIAICLLFKNDFSFNNLNEHEHLQYSYSLNWINMEQICPHKTATQSFLYDSLPPL